LGPLTGDIGFFSNGSQTLRGVRFTGQFALGGIDLRQNSVLRTLSGSGSARVLSIVNNPSLSQAAAESWAASVTATTKVVQGNKTP
jgi:hypothetical protein